jgi:heat-inducible transcriptional repressor
MIVELNARSREIFRRIVDTYVETGEPVGSRTLSRRLDEHLSPATIRNVMADLEEAGLLYAPHTSAGRLPTELGLRLYVDGLLESAPLAEADKREIESRLAGSGRSVEAVLREATETLSALARCAGLVAAPTGDRPFKHVEFVPLSPGRALVILVADNGLVENRIIEVPVGMPTSTLVEAGNYLTTRLAGRSFEEACRLIRTEIEERRTQLDELSQRLVASGLATWAEDIQREGGILLVRGQAHLLEDVTNLVELERIRALFEQIEAKKNVLRLVELTQRARGVQIFIGRENELFGLSGCSTIVAPYRAGDGRRSTVVGAIGVIGPTRLDYARVIPVVDYTARVVSRMLGTPESELE